jgi:hypothetical protein
MWLPAHADCIVWLLDGGGKLASCKRSQVLRE